MTEDTDRTEGAYEGKGLKGALWTIAGVAIGGLAARVLLPPGGGNPLFGGPAAGVNPLEHENMELRVQLAETRAQAYTDRAVAPQMAINAAQQAQLGFAATQIGQLYSLTQLMVPNRNVAPGWGPAYVSPFPPAAPEVATTATTTTANNG